MKQAILCLAVSLLCGCAASNRVLTQEEWNELELGAAGSATFSLPRLNMMLTYALQQKTFREGKHDKVVNYCAAKANHDQDLCRALRDVGIAKSMRLSKKPKARYCASDGSPEEIRVSIAEGAALTTGTEPDPSQVYFVPLDRSYFQTFDFTLELNADGTVGKGSLSTENLGAQDFITGISQLATTFLREAADAPEAPSVAERNLATEDLTILEDLLKRKATLVNEEADEPLASRAALITHLDASIAAAKGRFVGLVTTKPIPRDAAHWAPTTAGSRAIEGTFDACGDQHKDLKQLQEMRLFAQRLEPAVVDATAVGDAKTSGSLGWPYRVPALGKVMYGQCALPSPDPDAEAATVAAGTPVATAAAAAPTPSPVPAAPAGAAAPATPSPSAEAAPSPPAPAAVCDAERAAADNDALGCSCLGGSRVSIPQLGVVRRLPQTTGGRKSAISPEYHADGSLKKVTIAHVGESPAPLITAAKTLLTPEPETAPPTELQTLQSQATLIQARQALCRLVHGVEATDPLCQGPNPPTALE